MGQNSWRKDCTLLSRERVSACYSLIEVFDEWAAVAQHLDEVNRMVDIKEREMLRARQNAYRQELESQTREMQDRLKASKQANSEAERLLLSQQIGSFKKMGDGEVQKERNKKAVEKGIMNENLILKNRTKQEMKEAERREELAVMEGIRRTQEEERQKAEDERRSRAKVADALKMSHDLQESMKKQEKCRQKELDKMYCEQQKEQLMKDEQQRQRVSVGCNA